MFERIGTALGGPPTSHDRVPVRRHSHLVGRCEGTFWRRADRREVQKVLHAAQRYELVGRQKGRRNGPLGHIAIETLALLGNLMDRRTGRLEPSIDYLMHMLKRSRAAVVQALAALREHGFLDWLRRYEPTEREGRGPQIRQTSNAYRLVMPPRALRLLGAQGQPVPLPDDLEHEREMRAMEIAAQKAGLPLDEFALVQVDDGPLARALAVLGCSVQEREFGRQTESQSIILS